MSDLSFFSPAKINLGLLIHQKLPNGYHQVETIMHRLPLYDQLDLNWLNGGEDTICSQHEQVPNNSQNLIIKAYQLLKKDFSLPSVAIKLQKNIPVGAGLGGGSFNAGFFLQKINQHFQLGLTNKQLQNYGLQLGSDVPFATSQTACVWEKNHGLNNLSSLALPTLPPCQIVLVFFPYLFSTQSAYQQFVKNNDSATDLSALSQALQAQDLLAISKNLCNDFSTQTMLKKYEFQKNQVALLAAGAFGVNFTGKGPTIYALFPPESQIILPFAHQVIKIKKESSYEKN